MAETVCSLLWGTKRHPRQRSQKAETLTGLGVVLQARVAVEAGRASSSGALVATAGVVVRDVLIQDYAELAFAGDEHPVSAFTTHGPDEPFGDGVHLRRLRSGRDRGDAGRAEHRVERGGELDVEVPDQMGETMSDGYSQPATPLANIRYLINGVEIRRPDAGFVMPSGRQGVIGHGLSAVAGIAAPVEAHR